MTTQRLPRTAPEILARAAELGHVMAVERFGHFPDGGGQHERILVSCSCGWKAKPMASQKAAQGTVAWHLGKVIGQAHDVTNGQEAARPPVRAAARREDVRPTTAGAESA